ncbi:MAG: 5-oxoprolinase subunit PxpA [Burkholderiales bacterium]|nr:5-oxoprolinase subunit PxpA [Burkholderiales bacterium]
MTTINMNADMGESFGHYTLGNDEAIMRIIKSASIACGFHAGDPTVMATAVRLAKANGVSIGAHPGFNDLWGFGRRPIVTNPRDLEYMIAYQIGALQGIASGVGERVTHVKPHGALNNMAHVDEEVAAAIARGIKSVDRDIIFVANACSKMVDAGRKLGLRVAEEAYVDRTYDDSGQMTSRRQGDAMIKDPGTAARQVLSFIEEGALISKSGKRIKTRLHTFCTHGDEPTGVAVATAVRKALEEHGVRVAPLTEMEF